MCTHFDFINIILTSASTLSSPITTYSSYSTSPDYGRTGGSSPFPTSRPRLFSSPSIPDSVEGATEGDDDDEWSSNYKPKSISYPSYSSTDTGLRKAPRPQKWRTINQNRTNHIDMIEPAEIGLWTIHERDEIATEVEVDYGAALDSSTIVSNHLGDQTEAVYDGCDGDLFFCAEASPRSTGRKTCRVPSAPLLLAHQESSHQTQVDVGPIDSAGTYTKPSPSRMHTSIEKDENVWEFEYELSDRSDVASEQLRSPTMSEIGFDSSFIDSMHPIYDSCPDLSPSLTPSTRSSRGLRIEVCPRVSYRTSSPDSALNSPFTEKPSISNNLDLQRLLLPDLAILAPTQFAHYDGYRGSPNSSTPSTAASFSELITPISPLQRTPSRSASDLVGMFENFLQECDEEPSMFGPERQRLMSPHHSQPFMSRSKAHSRTDSTSTISPPPGPQTPPRISHSPALPARTPSAKKVSQRQQAPPSSLALQEVTGMRRERGGVEEEIDNSFPLQKAAALRYDFRSVSRSALSVHGSAPKSSHVLQEVLGMRNESTTLITPSLVVREGKKQTRLSSRPLPARSSLPPIWTNRI